MTTVYRHKGVLLSRLFICLQLGVTFLLATACTDNRVKREAVLKPQRLPPEALSPVNDVRINGKDITAFQMVSKGGALYLTGIPFFFTKWDITANPESPHPTFVAADDVGSFASRAEGGGTSEYPGMWRADYYGAGGLAVLGPYAIMSGILGTSFVNMSQTSRPVETKRYPAYTSNMEKPPQDDRFVYQAIGVHPQLPMIYGLREQDYMVVSQVSGGGLQPVAQIPYGAGNVCCVKGATVYQGKLFVAMGGSLRFYELASNGALSAPVDLSTLQAVDVVSTENLLYVHHQPSYAHSAGAGNPAGIYVFDASGNTIAFLPVQPLRFAVSTNDSHLYANLDDTSVRIYRILWTNR